MDKIDLENAMYGWFNIKCGLYTKMDLGDFSYWYYDGEEYADIWINKKNRFIYYQVRLQDEFIETFPIDKYEFKRILIKWFYDKFDLIGFTPSLVHAPETLLLKIPK